MNAKRIKTAIGSVIHPSGFNASQSTTLYSSTGAGKERKDIGEGRFTDPKVKEARDFFTRTRDFYYAWRYPFLEAEGIPRACTRETSEDERGSIGEQDRPDGQGESNVQIR